jgi:hypothetical protein
MKCRQLKPRHATLLESQLQEGKLYICNGIADSLCDYWKDCCVFKEGGLIFAERDHFIFRGFPPFFGPSFVFSEAQHQHGVMIEGREVHSRAHYMKYFP